MKLKPREVYWHSLRNTKVEIIHIDIKYAAIMLIKEKRILATCKYVILSLQTELRFADE